MQSRTPEESTRHIAPTCRWSFYQRLEFRPTGERDANDEVILALDLHGRDERVLEATMGQ